MKLHLRRFSDNGESTIGLLKVDGVFECFTLEDTHQDVKVHGETRIPAGVYKIELRNVGGMTQKYAAKFPGTHGGMIWLRHVPDFQYVYIHIGNEAKNSLGCILVGDAVTNNTLGKKGFVRYSTDAYKRLYKVIIAAIDRGENVVIKIDDEEE